MKPEVAIEKLRQLIEFRATKGSNPDYTQMLEDAVNSLIDVYNDREEMNQKIHDLQEDIEALSDNLAWTKGMMDRIVKIAGIPDELLDIPISLLNEQKDIETNIRDFQTYTRLTRMIHDSIAQIKRLRSSVPPNSSAQIAIDNMIDLYKKDIVKYNESIRKLGGKYKPMSLDIELLN